MNETRLRIEKISKQFPGVRALREVDLTLRRGEVHALIGENGAGKSTLMNIILGLHSPSGGTMYLDGREYVPHSPLDALKKGISMIHQEISLVNTMAVYENIWLGDEERFGGPVMVNKKSMIEAASQVLDDFGLDIDPVAEVGRLPISKMQMVEIVRAICRNSSIIIMDEPSSSLTDAEMEKLFVIVRRLRAEGKSIIYISHKMDEIFQICDQVTVFRDGQFVAEKEVEKVTKNELISLMVGREMSQMYPKQEVPLGDSVLEVRNLCREGKFHDVSFSVRSGEILGFCGLVGAGRTEIMRAVFALDPRDSGDIFLRGEKPRIKGSYDAIKRGIAMITEDRRGSGIIAGLSVKMNITLAYLRHVSRYGFIQPREEDLACQRMVEAMAVKAPSMDTVAALLSGGNQQKLIIGKWLLTGPDVLIMDEPTRGIDVGAKAEIYRLMGDLVAQGKAVIMVSSELPELMGVCDRILTVYQGKIAGEFERDDFDQERIMKSAFGLKEKEETSHGTQA